MGDKLVISAKALAAATDVVIVDCRYSLADPAEGRRQYAAGHIPGAHYLDLAQDLSGPLAAHGGRHPLPDASAFAASLAAIGIGLDTAVVAYDDARFAFAARLWWLMRALGYRPPRLLDGGYSAWLASGGAQEQHAPVATEVAMPDVAAFSGWLDRDGVIAAQAAGALLADAREPRRYAGLEEPIDPVAGHIPGAINRPWQGVTDEQGCLLDDAGLRAHWDGADGAEALVLYCGSGVTACVDLFSLAALGRDDALLYAGSWSDWCSHTGSLAGGIDEEA